MSLDGLIGLEFSHDLSELLQLVIHVVLLLSDSLELSLVLLGFRREHMLLFPDVEVLEVGIWDLSARIHRLIAEGVQVKVWLTHIDSSRLAVIEAGVALVEEHLEALQLVLILDVVCILHGDICLKLVILKDKLVKQFPHESTTRLLNFVAVVLD